MPGYKNNFDKSKSEKYTEETEEKKKKSFTIKINNLPDDVRIKELLEIYEYYGRIEERGINIKNYKENTIAFIKYTSHESALKAIESTDRKKFGYCVLNVELANN